MRTPRAFLLLGLAAAPLAAQGPGDAAAAVMPQAVSVKIGSGATAKTVTQTSIPFVFVLPLAVGAQQGGRVYRIGMLREGPDPLPTSFMDAMRALGWLEGQNLKRAPARYWWRTSRGSGLI